MLQVLGPLLGAQVAVALVVLAMLALAHADDARAREALKQWLAGDAAVLASRIVLAVTAYAALHAPTASGSWMGSLGGGLAAGLDAGLVLAGLAWHGLALRTLTANGSLPRALRLLPLALVALAVGVATLGHLALRASMLYPLALALGAGAVAACAWPLRDRDGPAAWLVGGVHAALALTGAVELVQALVPGSVVTRPALGPLPLPVEAVAEAVSLTLASCGWLMLLQGRLRARLNRLRLTDPLTGALNRQSVAAVLSRALGRAGNDDVPLCVALLDVERFRELNDVHGHDVGDRLLAVIARRSLRSLRGSDAVGRWDGGQFLVVMPDITLDDAVNVIDRLRRQIGDAVEADRLPPVSLIAGLWERPPRTTRITADQAVRAATAQLLRARRQADRPGVSARDTAW